MGITPLFSNHIIISRLGGVDQVGKGNAVKIVGDHRVQLAPHRQGAALGHAAALHGVLLQAGHRGQAALAQAQDAADGVLLGRFGQAVAAGLAAQPLQIPLLDKAFYARLQILFRDILSCGDLLQGNVAVVLMLRYVDHDTQRITALR